jgi:(carboxyethyl)arginine beta-lactam-synthase
MSTLPQIQGFGVRVGRAASFEPRLSLVGTRAALAAEMRDVAMTGVGIGPAASPLVHGDTLVLLAGELYHRESLDSALGGSPGDDAHRLLAACERYGLAAFRLLSGRFSALVVHRGRLVVATDHAGSVPTYLHLGPDALTVATELKALTGLPGGADAMSGTRPAHRAPGRHQVTAGTAVVFDLDGGVPRPVRSLRTWTPPLSRSTVDPRWAVSAVAERLAASVGARVAGDPAPTVVLSGGIDSSAVAAFALRGAGTARTVSLGTDAGDEFEPARTVAQHLGTEHTELKLAAADLLAELPWAVAAAEIHEPDILEYLLPLVCLYRRLPGPPRRLLTGYGADIPLGGMHRTTEPLEQLDEVIATDLATFDGLNEMSPLLSGVAGHWSTHPYWDREVLDLLVALEPGLKRRDGRDKWVLREATRGLLPDSTRRRAKLGIHEGSGVTSAWSRLLGDAGVPGPGVPAAKRVMAERLYRALVLDHADPAEVRLAEVMTG